MLNNFDYCILIFDNDLFSLFEITQINNTVSINKVNDKNNIHSSFHTILNDKSKGGVLLSKVIYHIHEQNKLNLPLFLEEYIFFNT